MKKKKKKLCANKVCFCKSAKWRVSSQIQEEISLSPSLSFSYRVGSLVLQDNWIHRLTSLLRGEGCTLYTFAFGLSSSPPWKKPCVRIHFSCDREMDALSPNLSTNPLLPCPHLSPWSLQTELLICVLGGCRGAVRSTYLSLIFTRIQSCPDMPGHPGSSFYKRFNGKDTEEHWALRREIRNAEQGPWGRFILWPRLTAESAGAIIKMTSGRHRQVPLSAGTQWPRATLKTLAGFSPTECNSVGHESTRQSGCWQLRHVQDDVSKHGGQPSRWPQWPLPLGITSLCFSTCVIVEPQDQQHTDRDRVKGEKAGD